MYGRRWQLRERPDIAVRAGWAYIAEGRNRVSRECCCPPPPDVLPPRPGGHPSPSTASAASRAVGFADGTAPDHGIMLRVSMAGRDCRQRMEDRAAVSSPVDARGYAGRNGTAGEKLWAT